ncbi:MAG: hypothetical protein WCJ39_05515 [bacterium]
MNISYAKSVIERAEQALASSQEETYKEMITAKLIAVKSRICTEEGVLSVNDISSPSVLRKDLCGILVSLLVDLEVAI